MSPPDGSDELYHTVLPAAELAEATLALKSAKLAETDTPQVTLPYRLPAYVPTQQGPRGSRDMWRSEW